MLYLKQSTAATVKIGPFVDNGDGYTPETALSIAYTDVRLCKNGADIVAKNEGSTCSHDELGMYNCVLNATDTGTLGRLQLIVSKSGALPVFHDFMIVTANVWDTMCGADYLDVNLNASQSGVTIGAVSNILIKTGFSLAPDQSTVTVGTTNNLLNKTGFALSNAGVDAVWDEPMAGHTTTSTSGWTVGFIRKLLSNTRTIVTTTETVFDDDGIATLHQWTLNSATPPISSKTVVP